MDLVPPAQKPFFAGRTLVVEAGHYPKKFIFSYEKGVSKDSFETPFST